MEVETWVVAWPVARVPVGGGVAPGVARRTGDAPQARAELTLASAGSEPLSPPQRQSTLEP
eukprot:3064494-Prymnesium_polylepis.2